jgi:molybdate/tungstate transport system substrate-binding protein
MGLSLPIPIRPQQRITTVKKPARNQAAYLISLSALLLGAAIVLLIRPGGAQPLTPLQVAYAGSMGSMMDGGVRPAIAKALGAELQGRASGSTGLANLIVASSIRPDVFISVTPGPMRAVLKAGKAKSATPIARTEMVIAYSPKSQYTAALAKAGGVGAASWWQILQTPGFRFGRTDPNTDPQGLNIIFVMQLAAAYYHQPGLAEKILGPQINPQQIFQEPQVMARLQAGQLDASSAYKTQPAALGLPFMTLPPEINLRSASMEKEYAKVSVTLDGKPHQPSPLVFYAAVLADAPQPKLASRFLTWLQSSEARQIFDRFHYDPPGGAKSLTP